MKRALWVRGVTHYLLPQLPGDWAVSPKGILYRRPAQWLLNCVTLHDSRSSTDFTNYKVVQLLSIPKRLLGGTQVSPLGRGVGRWPAPTNLTEAEQSMTGMLELIVNEAIPYFDQVGTVDGYAAKAETRAEELRVNVNDWEEVFCLRLIQGDIAGALIAAEFVRDTGHADAREFALMAAERVTHIADTAGQNPAHALDMLRRYADEMRNFLKIAQP